ncbi:MULTISPECIES: YppG family protein [Paraliobacillus]|uniref:YppG family protein n=1 Tax=Paraliobacillus TaxID=200903 RepID=UPI0013004866|nr:MULTISPECIES: YppG family protein [Paraliobacillus]
MPIRKPSPFLYRQNAGKYYNQPFQFYQTIQQQANYPSPTTYVQTPQQPQNISPYQYFAKPAQPIEWYSESNSFTDTNSQQAKGFMHMFQDKDGQMDLDKMLNTVGQMANTYQQVSPIIKGIGSFMKGIK